MGLFKDLQAPDCDQRKTPYLKGIRDMGVLGLHLQSLIQEKESRFYWAGMLNKAELYSLVESV